MLRPVRSIPVHHEMRSAAASWLPVSAAVVVVALLAAVDAVAGGRSFVLTLTCVIALLAVALVARPRQVLPLGVFALAIVVAGGVWHAYFLTGTHAARVGLVALAALVAVLGARARDQAHLARMDADRARACAEERAQTLQASLLPARLPQLDHWELAAMYRPGVEGVDVGGDFYDIFAVDRGLMILVGDATGKGVHAAAMTSLVRHTAKTAARLGLRPSAVLAVVNEALREQDHLSLVTLACADLRETGTGVEVTLASGGHPLPLRVTAGGHAEPIGRYGTLLGAVAKAPTPETRTMLRRGATLVFYTDGVTDTPGLHERFGEQRLIDIVATAADGPDALVARLEAGLTAFEHGPVTDDRAALALRYTGDRSTVRRFATVPPDHAPPPTEAPQRAMMHPPVG